MKVLRQMSAVLSVLTILGSLPIAAAAQDQVVPSSEDETRRTTVVFYTENDDWPPDTGTDKNYTNAFRLTLGRNYDMWSLRKRLPRLFGWIPELINCSFVSPFDNPDQRCASSSLYLIGQQFYTPDDITVSTLIPTDRPYAGWLYVGGSWMSSDSDALTRSDAYVGFTGAASLAEPTQSMWHKLVGAKDPKGWDHQIGGRLGIVIGHSRHRAFDVLARRTVRIVEFAPYAGATLGNIMTDGYAGAQLKIGWNLSRDWTQTGIMPRVGPAFLGRLKPQDFEFYFVFDGQGRAVAYNAFIDAAPNHTLDRKHLVADGGGGFGIRIKRVSVSYRIAFVSPEYAQALTHDYKAIRVTIGLGKTEKLQ